MTGPRPSASGPEPPLVVIADDEVHVVDLLTMVLEALGLRVVKAYNGEQALRAIREHRPRLVITDYMMPKLDGIQLTRGLRGTPELAATRVVLMTSLPPEALPVHGADAYVAKPFDLDEIEALVTRFVVDK